MCFEMSFTPKPNWNFFQFLVMVLLQGLGCTIDAHHLFFFYPSYFSLHVRCCIFSPSNFCKWILVYIFCPLHPLNHDKFIIIALVILSSFHILCTLFLFRVTCSQVLNQPQVGAKSLKLRKCGGFGACSQLSALKGGKRGRAGNSEIRLRRGTSYLVTRSYIQNQPTSWLVLIRNTPGVETSHGQFWTHLIHHGPNSEEATTFPHIVFSMYHCHTCI